MNKPYIPFLFSILSLALTSLDTEAHTRLGALGATATATDIYLATCLNDGSGLPDNLVGKIIDLPPVVAASVALTVSKDGKSVVAGDPVDGDSKYSPEVRLKGGAGVYTFTVAKSAKGQELYRFEFHCATATGVHTGSSIVKKQDQ